MSIALKLAHRGIGKVSPNPAVGCVIVKNNTIISRGWTQPGGRPHAENIAINNSRESLKGAVMYVTLEPCVHYGKTPPCVDLIIKSEISKVIVAIADPDQRVNGKGMVKLKESGIKVKYGICKTQAKQLNIGYFYAKILGRPYITVKLATTVDGKIATQNGESKWITNELSRKFGHKLRAQNDAIMIGSMTLIKDNPLLNCRLPGLELYSPVKIIADNKEKLNDSHSVLKGKEVLTFTRGDKIDKLYYEIESKTLENGNIDLVSGVKSIAKYGINRLLIEGGGKLVSSLLKDNIVDQIIWIRSNTMAGGDSIPAIQSLGVHHISELYKLKLIESRKFHDNQVEIFVKLPVAL